MKRCLVVGLVGLLCGGAAAETLTGYNEPGAGQRFAFTPASGITNLALAVDNSADAFSYLYLKRGGVASETNYDFAATLENVTNTLALEGPECVVTNYSLWVCTPTNSPAAHAFTVTLETDVAGLRSDVFPAAKPQAFQASGALGDGDWQYFQVQIPPDSPGWRLVLHSTGPGRPLLYVQYEGLPDEWTYYRTAGGSDNDTLVVTDTEIVGGTWYVGVYAPDGHTDYTLYSEVGWVRELLWDPGEAPDGTQVYTNASLTGGDYYFHIVPQATDIGAWRTALAVTGGEADLYQQAWSAPGVYAAHRSARTGSDGLVLSAYEYTPESDWYILVHATPGAQWKLLSGRAYVMDLGPLAADDSSSADYVVRPEGVAFFRNTVPTDTAAWRLWAYDNHGIGTTLNVRKALVPIPSLNYYEQRQNNQMLLVPPYLKPDSPDESYYVAVPGAPGRILHLDSRQQAVENLAFLGGTNLVVTGYGYRTYRVQVPVQQIAWQLNVTPQAGNPNVAVRYDDVPNEGENDAYSEAAAGVVDSVTLVPFALSDGTFYVTVYGTPPYTFSLASGNPTITDIAFTSATVNDQTTRTGWRYYRVADIPSQVGHLGWELSLANQVPGTEVAIRRNGVPGRWSYRTGGTAYESDEYVDASAIGDLQRPGNQADIWYIGIYTPEEALGAFTLTSRPLTATAVAFDGGGNAVAVAGQPADLWRFFLVTVPPGVLGWDLRLANVTSGNPAMVVQRETLPAALSSSGTWPWWYGYYPCAATNWHSGDRWAAASDWSGRLYDASGAPGGYGRALAMGMDNPLTPGTYYVGVIGSPSTTAPLSYTLRSRGVGDGCSIRVTELNYSGGTATTNGVAPREAAYYKVAVPEGAAGWQVRLVPSGSGEALLKVQRDCLPNIQDCTWNVTPYGYGGQKMKKTGKEQWALLPAAGTNALSAGTYYLAVVSEGDSPGNGSAVGANPIGYTVQSVGPVEVVGLGTAGPEDLLAPDEALDGGAYRAYRFTVPAGLSSLEVELEDCTGNPAMSLLASEGLAQGGAYGTHGGEAAAAASDNLVTLANPAAGTYTACVYADTPYADAAYTVRVRALTATIVAFDGGTATVTDQAANHWRYFKIEVPPEALGWDLRLAAVVSGSPRLVVQRDTLPPDLLTWGSGWPWHSAFYPCDATNWLSGDRWAAGGDWTGRWYDPSGQWGGEGRTLAMGMGNPLAPGTYYAGVFGDGSDATPMTYTLESHGIGGGFSIAVTELDYLGGSFATNGVAPREAAYYKVVVPEGAPSWQVRLTPEGTGEALLKIQKDCLPNIQDWDWSPYGHGGRKMQKEGKEQWALLPDAGTNVIPAGTYYLAVVSEGDSPADGATVGADPADHTLESFGPVALANLGTVGDEDLVAAGEALEGGAVKAYRFSVPPGVPSVEIGLESCTGVPVLSSLVGDALPQSGGYTAYGTYGGETGIPIYNNLLTVANPAEGTYTVSVYADNPYADATYTVRVRAMMPADVAFDNGAAPVSGQEAGHWQYFRIDVPAGALGWDVRLTDVVSGSPQLVVQRDSLPADAATWGVNWPWNSGYFPCAATNWLSGDRWAAGSDWTGRMLDTLYQPSGVGRTLAMGMGNPLEPGTYFVGVVNDPTDASPMSYTLLSRGIGDGFAIGVTELAYDGGTAATNALPPREAAYYKVVVPDGAPSWRARLTPVGTGEALLKVQKDGLPNIQDWYESPYGNGGQKLQKTGLEQWALLPEPGTNTIPAGTYYLAVVSEGDAPPDSNTAGTEPVDCTLESLGPVEVVNLGTAGAIDLVAFGETLEAGALRAYRFDVPPASESIDVMLVDASGGPLLTLSSTNGPAQAGVPFPAYYPYYGTWGGEVSQVATDDLIVIPHPAGRTHWLCVYAGTPDWVGGYQDASYTLRVRQSGPPAAEADLALTQRTDPPQILVGETVTFDLLVTNRGPDTATSATVSITLPDGMTAVSADCGAGTISGAGPLAWSLGALACGQSAWARVAARADVQGTLQESAEITSDTADPAPANNACVGTVTATLVINFSDNLNTNGLSNTASGSLANNQRLFYKVAVPVANAGHPVIGWRLALAQSQGLASVRVRKDLLPADGTLGTSPFVTAEALIAPPFLTPGTWYVEVCAQGITDFTLTSRDFALERPVWEMPAEGQAVTTPGLAAPEFGDTGTGTNSVALPGDRGIDLENGHFHYYAFRVPTNGAVLLRAMLEAISGNPDIYVRSGNPPTLSHDSGGYLGALYDISRTGTGTEYGDWVPRDGRYTPWLTNGTWYVAVRAASDANARYRLHLTAGTVTPTNLNFTLTGQVLAGGDWRYYRVQVPTNAPAHWNVTLTQLMGDTVLYVRDTCPPGMNVRPGAPSPDLLDWSSDAKNDGPYPSFSMPGTYDLAVPPLRPGSVYYLGVRALDDAVFSLQGATGGGTFAPVALPFAGAASGVSLPPYGSAQFAVTVPAGATQLAVRVSSDPGTAVYAEQGTLPYLDSRADWQSGGAPESLLSVNVRSPGLWPWVPGQTYYLVCTNSTGAARSIAFTTGDASASAPANDRFANRIGLRGTNATAFGSNVRATKEPGEPNHAGDAGGQSVWWTWTAPFGGTATISTAGSGFNTSLAVYTNDTLGALGLVAQDAFSGPAGTSLLSAEVAAGQAYQIAVDGYGGQTGAVVLAVSLATPSGLRFAEIVRPGNGTLGFRIEAARGMTNCVDVSADLLNWQPLTNIVSPEAVWEVIDADAALYPVRFYRIRAD